MKFPNLPATMDGRGPRRLAILVTIESVICNMADQLTGFYINATLGFT